MPIDPKTSAAAAAAIEILESRTLLSTPPTQFSSRGPGGGGALFSPSFSPFNSSELYTVTDMSAVYHSTTLGQSWNPIDFRQLQGGRPSQVQFTSDPSILYTIDTTNDLARPVRSTDGGAHWTPLPGWDPADIAYALYADPGATNRLIVSDYGSLYFSSDGGATFTSEFTAPNAAQGCVIAGAFFDGANIYVGTSAGLVVSSDNGVSFHLDATPGLPAGTSMFSFAGATQNGVTRFFCTLLNSADVYNGMFIEGVDPAGHDGVYSLTLGDPSWVADAAGLPPDEFVNFVSTARNDPSVAYLAGSNIDTDAPAVLKTTTAGASWTDVLHPVGNQNVITGWQGQGGDRGWGYGEIALGLGVCPTDPNTLAWADLGFLHLSTDGGATWRQAYVNPADQNPAGANTPQHKAYHGVGLEDTSAHWITWADPTTIVAGYTDIYGVRSTDSGSSWAFPTGLNLAQNTVYQVTRLVTPGVASGVTLYAATSNTHDIYQSTHLTNSALDAGSGRIISSTDKGATWSVLHDFGHPVIYTAADPTNPNRLYAAVVSSTAGGIYATSNLSAGASSTWTRLPAPPRTEGHAFNVDVLNDGTLVATYSAHRNPNFTPSSGVFVSIDGGQTWADRTLIGAQGQPGMQYWTKDLTIDPTDPTQNTWYAAVRSGYGGDGSANDKGGLYKTTNHGATWTRIFSADSCESCTITASGEMYLATLQTGLWYSANPEAPIPTFTQLSYPFRQPERIFVNPYNTNQIWVAGFGYGLAVGSSTTTTAASVVARRLFYNNSVFDAAGGDDAAIDPSKIALLPGQHASPLNLSGYSSGINGIMLDVAGLPVVAAALSAADFSFKAGATADVTTWTTAPAPTVAVRRAAGANGSDRVTLTWPDGAIANEWLQVTVKGDVTTGLNAPDVFYFGNLIGDSGNDAAASAAIVSAADLAAVRVGAASPVTVGSPADYNKDGSINDADIAIARANLARALPWFTAPAPAAAIAAANATVAPPLPPSDESSCDPLTKHGILKRRCRSVVAAAAAAAAAFRARRSPSMP